MNSESSFKAAFGLRNRHLQTILPNLGIRPMVRPRLRRETLELEDGDFLHLDWLAEGDPDPGAPVLICLHGLEGSSRSNYAADLMRQAREARWHGLVMHFRGCSGTMNRLPRTYHAGATADLHPVLAHVRSRLPESRGIHAAGFSLGGNMLLKFLGETGADCPLVSAVTVSVPFDLLGASVTIDRGFARLYQWVLMRKMLTRVRQKASQLEGLIDLEKALASRTFVEFDDAVTAPLHGFSGYRDYYEQCSSIRFMHRIAIPTLVLHARDDPFLAPGFLPRADQVSPCVTLEYTEHGGHVGFVGQKKPWQPAMWLPRRMMEYFTSQDRD